MALNWNYEKPKVIYEILKEGTYRVRIEAAEERTSRAGKDMIYLELAVSGSKNKLFHYIVFDPENRDRTNKALQSIFDSFGIEAGNFTLNTWVGKVGACKTKVQKDDNYGDKAVVHYFIDKSKAAGLPAWVEPSTVGNETAQSAPQTLNISASDLPF